MTRWPREARKTIQSFLRRTKSWSFTGGLGSMAPTRALHIVIPGGSGHLGTLLARHFHEQNQFVTVISRYPKAREWQTVHWEPNETGPWTESLSGADVVINLAGRSVNCRYNAQHRREIENSRIVTTALIGEAIAQSASPPRLWLNASTATIYRQSEDEPMDEITGEMGGNEPDLPSSWQFSIDVATSWERAFFSAETPQTRKVALRSAMVMSPDNGGAFDAFLRLVRYGVGGRAGSGRQFVSWIHDVDFIRSIEFLISREDLTGPANICSPFPVTNEEFMWDLRRAWSPAYIGIPLPRPLLELGAFLLRSETELVLKSRRVIPRRLLDAGFEFHFPNWRGASQDLVRRWRDLRN
jgi:uncharacterized protein (TIGR01777 family)